MYTHIPVFPSLLAPRRRNVLTPPSVGRLQMQTLAVAASGPSVARDVRHTSLVGVQTSRRHVEKLEHDAVYALNA